MSEIRIARAEDSDLPAICDLANWAIETTTSHFNTVPESLSDWRLRFEREGSYFPWLVARRDGDFAGYAKANAWKGRGAYDWTVETAIYVHPNHHRVGVGKKLYEELLSLLKRQRFRTVVAVVSLPNPASVRLHQALGFEQFGTLKRAGFKRDRWLDVSYWQVSLDGGAAAPDGIVPISSI